MRIHILDCKTQNKSKKPTQMNSIELIVVFENVPSKKNKEIIQSEIEKFFLEIDPHMDLEITTGDGSWWISAFFWGGQQFLAWLAKKGFDSIFNESKKILPKSYKQILIGSDQEPKNVELASKIDTEVSTKETSPYDVSFVENIGGLMNVMDKLGEGKKTIIFCRYNSSNDFGHVMKLTKENDETILSIIQTDSKDDYSKIVKH